MLDPWLEGQPDESIRHTVLEAMAVMAEEPEDVDDDDAAHPSPLVHQLLVPGTDVIVVYLRAEQYRTFQLISITDF